MGRALTFKTDLREFTSTLRKYSEYSKRDIPVICNTKAYYIARRATVETPAVSKAEIQAFIDRDGGKIVGMLINKRRGARGEKGLFGKAMEAAVMLVRAARLRARAFVKSGWIPAIKKLEPFAERPSGPRIDRTARIAGRPKGSAIPASRGWRVRAQIENTVTAAWDKQEGAAKIAEPALQRAFSAEEQSMLDYIERKQKAAARSAGIKTK